METPKSVYDNGRTWGLMGVDSQERVNYERLRRDRLARAKDEMKKNDLDALLLFDGHNIRYISGIPDFQWRMMLRYCILPRDADPIMFEPVGPDLENAKRNSPWIKDFRPPMPWKSACSAEQYMMERFASGVKQTLSDYKVLDGRLGADMLDPAAAKELAKVGVTLADGRKPMADARMVKTRDELEILKQVCAVGDAAYWKARHEWVKPGMRECEIKGRLSDFHYSYGCENYTGNVAAGSNSSPYYRGGATDNLVRAGDYIILDVIGTIQGYCSDYVRSWVVGGVRPTKEQKETYMECHDILQNVLKAVRPGAKSSEIAERLQEDDEEATTGTTSMVNGGHGVGLAPMEPPFITRAYSLKYPEEIKQNMCLSFEIYVHTPDWKTSARLEDQIVVTDSGYERYTKFPYEEELLS